MLRGEPILKFVERFDGRENGGGDFNGFRFHGGSLSRFAGKGKGFPFHGFSGNTYFAGAGVGVGVGAAGAT
jgi:hypothetical protein